jgi:hypothetical protein
LDLRKSQSLFRHNSEIEKAETNLKGCAERQEWVKSKESRDQASRKEVEEERNVFQKEANEFLQLLFKNGSHYKDTIKRNRKRVVGTCDWFTNHDAFKEWDLPGENQGRNLLYVTADPGCGKSVLSAYLVDEILPDDGRTVCYFFFKDDFEHQKRSLRALSSLLHQIFTQKPSALTEGILQKYRERGDPLVESFSEMWTVFLAASAGQETVCVVDALDECHEPDRNQLSEAITLIRPGSNQRHNLKFLLTSRPYPHIRNRIVRGPESRITLIHLQGDSGSTANEIAAEIEIVMNQRIAQTAEDCSLTTDERTLLEQQLNTITNRTYLWLTLVFDGLMEQSYITKRDIMDLTKKLPQGVYDAYEKILRRTKDQGKTRRLLNLILGAERPLSLTEISVALIINGQQSWDELEIEIIPENRIRDAIRDICGLFVTIVDEKVYLLHQTAREFLVRGVSEALPASKPWQHSMDLASSHSVLAEVCISCLQPGFAKYDTSMFGYSASFWTNHYHQSTETCQDAMAEMCRDLCMDSETSSKWTDIQGVYWEDHLPGSTLCLAAALGLHRAMEMFLHEKDETFLAEIDFADGKFDRTPLSWAAGHGYEVVVKQLLATGMVDINSKDNYHGQTPLSWAAEYGQEAVVKQLLESGSAEADARDKYDKTPLFGLLRTEKRLWSSNYLSLAGLRLTRGTGTGGRRFRMLLSADMRLWSSNYLSLAGLRLTRGT